jgi:uncharacterized protein YqfB (UPF0267 family)
MKHAKSLITLAVACLLALPAFSMPWNDGAGRDGRFDQLNLTEEEMENMTLAELRELKQESNQDQCPMNDGQMNQRPMNNGQMNQCPMNNYPMMRGFGDAFLLMDDLTEEEIENMTLAEINEMRQQKMDEFRNMTAEEIESLREEKRAEMENMTIAELREVGEKRFDRPFIGGGACLLVADLTAEELEGMTLEEIEALKEEKMAELNNMTLAEIEALKEEWTAEMENMTLAEVKEQMEICNLLGLGGFGKDHKMAPQGCHGGQFGTDGFDRCNPTNLQGIQQNQCGMAGAGMNQQGGGALNNKMNGPGFGGQR